MGLMCALAGCAQLDPRSCRAGLAPVQRVDLYFGRAMAGGGVVTDEDWQRFVDQKITPRFPDGLTVTDVAGQWRGQSGVMREPAKHVTIIISTNEATRLDAIRADYRAQFHQESVLLLEAPACGAF
jgi:hypothetical protein